MKKIFASILSLLICFSLCAPALAANETNTLGVTFSAELDQSELTVSDVDQTVVLTVKASETISTCSIDYTVVCDGLTVAELAGDGVNVTGATTNTTTQKLSWSANGGVATAIDTIAVVTITVPANTAAGTYEIGITNLKLSQNYGLTIIENGASASATLTITDSSTPATDAYTVTMSSSASTVTGGDSVDVYLDVTHSDNTAFAAFSATMSYDSSLFTYTSGSEVNGFDVASDTAGELKISRTGNSVTIPGEGAELTLAFTANNVASNSSGSFTLDGAKVGAQNTAQGEDAPEATVAGSPLQITITVEEDDPTLESIAASGTYQTEYEEGDSFDPTGMTVTAYYSDSSEKTVTDSCTFAPDPLTAGTTSVTISYTDEAGSTRTTTVSVTVTEKMGVEVTSTSTTYLSSEGYKLIEVTATNLPAGSVPTYNGEPMFQVKNAADGTFYDESAYYYIVATGDYDDSLVSYGTGTATVIDHAGTYAADSNGTEVIDINDAQFIYNIYSDYYSELTAAELLRADVNGDGAVNVSDCAAVVAAIFS